MPPAFNLSQDQTLQFNLCYFAIFMAPSLLTGRSLKILTGHYFHSAYFITSCEHLIFFKFHATRRLRVHFHQTSTLIDCKLLKNFIRYCLQLVDKAFCLSVAKKEEYEAFRCFRQPSFLLLNHFLVRPVHRIYIPFCGGGEL